MGAKRKVDLKQYTKISKELKSPKDDKKVMAKYNLGQTTVRAIRNSVDYYHFLNKTSANRKVKKMSELYPKREPLTAADRVLITCTWIGIFAVLGVVFMIFRWIVSLAFGG